MSDTKLWVVCGAVSGVGKTRVARRLCEILPDAIYAKQGCGTRRPDGPENFFQSNEEVDAFVEQCRPRHRHIVLESNEAARIGRGDVIIFIDAAPGTPDVRDDAGVLRSAAHLCVSPAATIREWKQSLRQHVAENPLREAICDCLTQQKRHLFPGPPEVRVKVWFVESGMHIFGAGLARLLEHIERCGTLREAATRAKMSYRHAWGLIKNAEKHGGYPLIVPQPGGARGGQSTLTDHGRHLLRAYRRFGEKVDELARECFTEASPDDQTSE